MEVRRPIRPSRPRGSSRGGGGAAEARVKRARRLTRDRPARKRASHLAAPPRNPAFHRLQPACCRTAPQNENLRELRAGGAGGGGDARAATEDSRLGRGQFGERAAGCEMMALFLHSEGSAATRTTPMRTTPICRIISHSFPEEQEGARAISKRCQPEVGAAAQTQASDACPGAIVNAVVRRVCRKSVRRSR